MTTATLPRDSYWNIAAPVLFVLLWSTGFIGGKLGLPYAEPFTFLLWRYGIVTLLLLAVTMATRAPWPDTPLQALHIAVAGVLVNAIYIGGVFSAIYQGVPAGIVSLIVGLQPLFTAVVAGRLLGETVNSRQWAGFGLGLAGVLLVLLDKITFAAGTPLGLVVSLLALCGITAGTIYQKRYCAAMDMRSGGVIQFAASTLVMGLAAPLCETMQIRWSATFLFALVWLVVVLSLGAITLLNILIRRGAASRVASLFYLVPPVTSLLAFLVFGERLGIMAMAGMVVTVTGVALAVRK